MASLLLPLSGAIVLDQNPLQSFSHSQLSRQMALVSSEPFDPGHFRAYEIAAFGRYPYVNRLASLNASDHQIVQNYLTMLQLNHLANKQYAALSQGEALRVLIARAFIQTTPFILMDEPLSHLDLQHQIELLALLRQQAKNENKTIVFTSHEIKLTCLFADYLLVLMPDHQYQFGLVETILAGNALDKAYQLNAAYFDFLSYSVELNVTPENKNVWIRGISPELALVARFFIKHHLRPFLDIPEPGWLRQWAEQRGLLLSKSADCKIDLVVSEPAWRLPQWDSLPLILHENLANTLEQSLSWVNQ